MAAAAAPARAAGPTRLAYFDDMWALRSTATVLSLHQEEGGRRAVVLDATIFHPQGGGQPADTGVISASAAGAAAKFLVEDVRAKDGVVSAEIFHDPGMGEHALNRARDWADFISCHLRMICAAFVSRSSTTGDSRMLLLETKLDAGQSVTLEIDAERRSLNSRLHSAGHLLDSCMTNLGLHLEPGKGYHFPDGPSVEYKGVVPADQLQGKKIELEKQANELISKGAKVLVSVFPYEEAAKLCGVALPSYISQVTGIRVKKGVTKVSYSISP